MSFYSIGLEMAQHRLFNCSLRFLIDELSRDGALSALGWNKKALWEIY